MQDDYFEWIYALVSRARPSWRKLLRLLHKREFVYILDMDGNRADDGTDLRYRFGYEQGYGPTVILTYLDNRPCSVLEMMVAISIRCEEHIMENPDVGDQTGRWFWGMIESLGLSAMSDGFFDEAAANRVITTFLRREYRPDGRGGLFVVEGFPGDLRKIEIWYQMMEYLGGIARREDMVNV